MRMILISMMMFGISAGAASAACNSTAVQGQASEPSYTGDGIFLPAVKGVPKTVKKPLLPIIDQTRELENITS